MSAQWTEPPAAPGTLPPTAEARLERTRAKLRRTLRREAADESRDGVGEFSKVTQLASPMARQIIRDHPYTSLSIAAMTGLILMRWKPWKGLSGSLLAGLLARQLLSYALSSRGRAFDWFLNRTFKYKAVKAAPPVPPPPFTPK